MKSKILIEKLLGKLNEAHAQIGELKRDNKFLESRLNGEPPARTALLTQHAIAGGSAKMRGNSGKIAIFNMFVLTHIPFTR